MSADFSFCAPDDFLSGNIRMHSQLEPFGCLGDLGWYCIRFMLWAMNWEMPTSVTGRLLASQGRGDSPHPVPMECSAELVFPSGVSAGFYCSFQTENQQLMTLSGTKGYLHMPDFVLPFFGSDVGFEVTNSVFKNTRGTRPSAGIDLEPDRETQTITNVRIAHSKFLDNALQRTKYGTTPFKPNMRKIEDVVYNHLRVRRTFLFRDSAEGDFFDFIAQDFAEQWRNRVYR